jgi:hypothetical protein
LTATPARSYGAIAVAIVIAGVLVSASLYVAVEAPKRTTTTTSATSQTTSLTTNATSNQASGATVSGTATDGLKLSTSMNATELKVGQRLGLSISLSNALPEVNAVNTSANFPFNGVAVQLWPYCYGVPARIAILQGNYSIQELPAVTNVTLRFVCTGGGEGISSAVFQPNSDQVDLNGIPPPYLLSLNFTTSGSYDLANLSQQDFEPVITQPGFGYEPTDMPRVVSFAPGIYTVAVADEWGGYNILHFEVTPWQQPTPTAVANSANNLQLRLFLNSSSSATGLAVSVTVDDHNALASTNNVTAANDWLVPLNYIDGAPCGDNDAVVGFAVAEGHDTLSNVTAATLLPLVNPKASYNCPAYLGYGNPKGFLFQPMSDTAASYGCVGVSPICPTGSAFTGLTSLSWAPATGFYDLGGAFTSFPHGTYTVLAEDEWGDSALAYFTVS